MKKLTLVFVLIPFVVCSQTIVETTPKERNVVLEMFTGVNCPYCPEGAAIANSIYHANPDKVVLIAIHQGSFSAPSGTQPDFRTPFGNSLATLAGVQAYPSGTVNRHFFPSYAYPSGSQNLAMMRNNYSAAANAIMQENAYLNVGATAQINATTREISVYVEVYYTGSSPDNINKLNIVLLQDKTYGPQAGTSAGNNYEHNNRLVHMITGQWGAEIIQTTTGSLYSNTFTYTIPQHYNNIPAELVNMRVAVFVTQNNNKETINGIQITPTLVNIPTQPEFSIVSNTTPTDVWEGKIASQFVLRSLCENLQGVNIRYRVNNEEYQYHNWEGNLSYGSSVTIILPEINFFPLLQNTLTVEITDNDNSPENNSYTVSFVKAPATTSTNLTVSVKPDAYGSEITWKIKNQAGAVVASGGPYANNNTSVQNHSVTLTLGNYVLEAYDSYGDGVPGGYIRILNNTTTVVEINGSSYSSYSAKKFRIVEPVTILFNPENGSTDIAGSGPYHVVANKALFTAGNALLTAENAALAIRFKQNNASGQNIPYTVSVINNREITITPIDTIPTGTTVYMAFVGKDEDGISINQSTTFTIKNPVGIEAMSDFAVSIYPNPTKDSFRILGVENGVVSVYTADSRIVLQQAIYSNNSIVTLPKKISNLFFVAIQSGSKSVVKTLFLTE